jgi:hypothetical protein
MYLGHSYKYYMKWRLQLSWIQYHVVSLKYIEIWHVRPGDGEGTQLWNVGLPQQDYTRNIPEGSKLHTRRLENSKSNKAY